MTNYQEFKKELMQDPEFRAEYERTRPEFEIMHALIDARINSNMTQQELSAVSGVRQSNISRIENGKRDPSLYLAQKLAIAMGYTIKFVPIAQAVKEKSIVHED